MGRDRQTNNDNGVVLDDGDMLHCQCPALSLSKVGELFFKLL